MNTRPFLPLMHFILVECGHCVCSLSFVRCFVCLSVRHTFVLQMNCEVLDGTDFKAIHIKRLDDRILFQHCVSLCELYASLFPSVPHSVNPLRTKLVNDTGEFSEEVIFCSYNKACCDFRKSSWLG